VHPKKKHASGRRDAVPAFGRSSQAIMLLSAAMLWGFSLGPLVRLQSAIFYALQEVLILCI
jgi:hypothetical protein